MKRQLAALLALTLPLTAATGQQTAFPASPSPAAAPLNDPNIPPAEVGPVPIALLIDLGSGQVLYAKEPDRRFVPASITKVMTLYLAFELLSRGQLKPEQVFRMSEDAYRKWHAVGSTMFLDRQHDVTAHELLMGIANVSANDGCIVLAEGAAGSVPNWIALMNAEARRLGMKDSHFGTPNGWMDKGNTYVSANDLVKLASAMLTRYPDYYRRFVGQPGMVWNGIAQPNHDPTLGVVPGADGIKTGFTGEAHYNYLGSAERHGRRLIMVLAGVEKPGDRAKAARALMEWGFDQWDDAPLFAQGQKLGAARVHGGLSDDVPLLAPRQLSATVPHGTREKVSMKITYNGPLQAPIAKGSQIARLEVKMGQDAPIVLPLVAGADVPAGGWVERFMQGFRRFFA